jgi:hypothetical protein
MKYLYYILFIIAIYVFIELLRVDRPIEKFKNNTQPDTLQSLDTLQPQDTPYKIRYNNIKYLSPSDVGEVFPPSSNYLKILTGRKIAYKVREFQTRDSCLEKYNTGSLLPITPTEIEAFDKLLCEMSSIVANTPLQYLLDMLLRGDVKIAKGNIWLEGGMPHTHYDTIIMPHDMFRKLTQYKYGRPTDNFAIREFGLTLIHELVHIEQRIEPEKYEHLYENWGFQLPTAVNGMEHPLYMNRINPDGLENKWIWQPSNLKNINKWYWIGAIHKDNAVNLKNVEYIAHSVQYSQGIATLNNITRRILLEDFKPFINYFGITNNHYHPNEISAEYMSIYYIELLDGKMTSIHEKDGYQTFVKTLNL